MIEPKYIHYRVVAGPTEDLDEINLRSLVWDYNGPTPSRMPLGSTEKPAGAFKQEGCTDVAMEVMDASVAFLSGLELR